MEKGFLKYFCPSGRRRFSMTSPQAQPVLIPATAGRRLPVLGSDITVKLNSAQTAGSAYVFESVSPPGAGVPPHVHEQEDELLTVLEGEVEVLLDGNRSTASAGAVASFPRGVPHAFTNTGERPARIFWVVTPGENFEKFFDDASKLPSDAPPDLGRIGAISSRYGITILASSVASARVA
jgi:quercetin dioxygenase-like cupin family protein